MSDLRQQIHDYYAARSLPPERVTAVLAQADAALDGQTDASSTKHPLTARRGRQFLALAASVAILAGVLVFFLAARTRADYAKLRPAVMTFFADEPVFAKESEQSEELRAWAIAQGAPAAFRIPSTLRKLDTKGCAVLDVEEKPAYLLCFLTEDKNGQRDGGMVHLVVARRKSFRNLPPSEPPSIQSAGKWSFASWTEGDILYTVATPASVEKLRDYLALPGNPRRDGQNKESRMVGAALFR